VHENVSRLTSEHATQGLKDIIRNRSRPPIFHVPDGRGGFPDRKPELPLTKPRLFSQLLYPSFHCHNEILPLDGTESQAIRQGIPILWVFLDVWVFLSYY
jgi:hypothetical protein